MNDIFELWSAPWHALQHSLASRFGAEAAAGAAARPLLPGIRSQAQAPDTWLMRARRVALEASGHNAS